MRTVFLSIFGLFLFFLMPNEGFAQKNQTKEFTVNGACDMCRVRIENAALIKGVKFAKWDKEGQKIKVIFNGKKIDEQKIHEAIAKAGHDTSKVKAKKEDYEKLPGCCKYKDGVGVH